MEDEIPLIKQLESLRGRHRELDEAIETLTGSVMDEFQLRRLKKEKLMIRDQIMRLEEYIYPDITA